MAGWVLVFSSSTSTTPEDYFFQKLSEEPSCVFKTSTMKLHLLVALLVSVVVMSAAQQDPRDFDVLYTETKDEDGLEELQPKAREALSQLREYTIVQREMESAPAREGVSMAPGYSAALKANLAAFANSSVIDVLWTGEETHATSLSTARKPFIPSLYYCPHRNYLLTWFSGSSNSICFVPWAWNQAITYARCSNRSCSVRFNRPNTGRCLPSCFTRRYILARCFRLYTSTWRWSWEIKNLPQACRCSSC